MRISFFNYSSLTNRIDCFLKKTVDFSKKQMNRLFKKNYDNQDVILFFTAKSDRFGALSLAPRPFLNHHLSNSRKIRIIKKTVSNTQEINKAIDDLKKQNANIKGLWIQAHGNPQAIGLGPKESKGGTLHNDANGPESGNLTGENKYVKKFKKSLEKLDPDAFIVLESCKTGQVKNKRDSVAQSLAKLVPGITVFAAKNSIDSLSTSCRWVKDSKNKLRLTVEFKGLKKLSGKGWIGCLSNICYLFTSIIGFGREDCMVKYNTLNAPNGS